MTSPIPFRKLNYLLTMEVRVTTHVPVFGDEEADRDAVEDAIGLLESMLASKLCDDVEEVIEAQVTKSEDLDTPAPEPPASEEKAAYVAYRNDLPAERMPLTLAEYVRTQRALAPVRDEEAADDQHG